ncbi:MAG: hypothetical protein E7640_04060 [Ruminococcaceae bacterium]|nr:hypothetical protein [Oscillospiraceae bacterium]
MLILNQIPKTEKQYTDYSVTVNGNAVGLNEVRVSAIPYNTWWQGIQRPLDQTELAAMLKFEADEPVTVTVTYPKAPQKVVVRPMRSRVEVTIEGCTATFVLPSSGAYTVEADGIHNALHVFFDPIKSFEEYTKGAKTVLRYGAGVHCVGRVELFSDTTVILDRDAYIYGSFLAINAENVTICGYGVIDGSLEERVTEDHLIPQDFHAPIPYEREELLDFLTRERVLNGCIRFYRCKNVRVEGVIMRDSSTFCLTPAQCDGIFIENVKTIGMWRYNSDGIDLFNCRNAVIRGCFLRNFDDCIVLKGVCGWDDLDMENILVEGCIIWCDWGQSLEIGAETNAPAFHDILFRDCDCIHSCTVCCDVQHNNRADVYNVTFDNIRCEYTVYQMPKLLQERMDIPYNPNAPLRHPRLMAAPIYNEGRYSEDGLNGSTHDIVFKNIHAFTDGDGIVLPPSIFVGVDDEHTVSRIRIENITLDGRRLSAEEIELKTNDYAFDITVV